MWLGINCNLPWWFLISCPLPKMSWFYHTTSDAQFWNLVLKLQKSCKMCFDPGFLHHVESDLHHPKRSICLLSMSASAVGHVFYDSKPLAEGFRNFVLMLLFALLFLYQEKKENRYIRYNILRTRMKSGFSWSNNRQTQMSPKTKRRRHVQGWN